MRYEVTISHCLTPSFARRHEAYARWLGFTGSHKEVVAKLIRQLCRHTPLWHLDACVAEMTTQEGFMRPEHGDASPVLVEDRPL
jgi:hypothetical protein